MSEKAHRAILDRSRRKYPRVHSLVKSNGPISLSTNNMSLFDYMAKTVTGQQLSNAAARTIWSRIQAMVSNSDGSLAEYCCEVHFDDLRACGLSGNKAKALIALNSAFSEGAVSEEAIREASHEKVVELITSIWGFGGWSADMIAIFYCGLPDVWSDGDVSLQKGLKILSAGAEHEEIPAKFSPYKSYLALHVWKGIDEGGLSGPKNLRE